MQKALSFLLFTFLFFSVKAQITPDANGIIYVNINVSGGNGNGDSWPNATTNLQGAINANGAQKVFVAIGNYDVPSPSSFVMKKDVAIYGGFDPNYGITNLSHSRVMPNAVKSQGSVLNGKNERPVIWNSNNGLTATAILDGFTITRGIATNENGGGMHNYDVSPTIINCVFSGNTARYGGGIVNARYSSPIIINCVFSGNTATIGGGMYNTDHSSPVVTNCVFSGNNATSLGGGMCNNGLSSSTVTNTIIYGNNTGIYNSNATATVTYSNVQYVAGAEVDYSNGTGNMNIDPLFVNAPDYSTAPFTGGDYSLKSNSSVINKGALYAGLSIDTKDLAGNSRVYNYSGGGRIDLGAYEYTVIAPGTGGIIYVQLTATGNGTGSSWDNATNDLHNAIHTSGVQKVFVSIGNYNVGSSSFIMKNGVEIYGGFDPLYGITDLTHNRIMPNASNGLGSVLNGQNTRPVIWNVFTSATVMDNSAVLDGFALTGGAFANGAGIRNVYASPLLRNLVIRGNNATTTAGGIYNENSSPVIINTVINGNGIVNSNLNATVYGAGIYNTASSVPILTNITITGNTLFAPVGTMKGGGIYNNNSSPKIYNSIIWNNQKMFNPNIAGADIENEGSGTVILKNSITQLYTTGNTADNNMVNTNPQFVSTADFSLHIASPAINAGDNTFYAGLNAQSKDLAGNLRLKGINIDIGAYEFSVVPNIASGIVYVKPIATGSGNGSSWNDATANLQEAIDANGTQKVFVAIGNYNAPANSFVMKNNVAIYGGFDPVNNITTLDDTRILPTLTQESSVLNGENARRVIHNNFTSATALNSTAVLDGFTVTGGNTSFGSGMYNIYASPTLANLVIKANTATVSGGGIASEYASPTLTNVVISGNTITSSGTGRGGGMYNYSSSPMLTNVAISNNTVAANNSVYGGAVYNYLGTPKFINVSITDNTASSTSTTIGGAMFNSGSNLSLTNVTIAANKISGSYVAGGGIQNSNSTINIYNSIFWGNQQNGNAAVADADIQSSGTGTLILKNSITQIYTTGNVADNNLVGIDPLFFDAVNGDYTLKSTSPAINTGDNTFFTGLDANTKDLVGNSRVYNFNNSGVIDLGAYESSHNSPLVPDGNGIIYVKEEAIGTGSGIDWNNATADLHNAIHATGVSKVFVAVGNYNVGGSSFVMKNNVEIYGGFDPDNNIKILSDNRILPTLTQEGSALNGQNVRPIIWNDNNGVNTSAILDGFTVKNGRTTNGGGIYNNNTGATFRNLVIKNNQATSGGGICNLYSSPTFTNCIIASNVGSGVFNSSSSNNLSSPIFTNCVISGNTGESGGGVHNSVTSAKFINCLITGNTATNFLGAGGVFNAVTSAVTFTNSTIAGNNSDVGYKNNKEGGTILQNSIIWEKVEGSYTAYNSLIKDKANTSNDNIDATGLADTDVFTDPANGDYTLKANSVAIDAGDGDLFEGLDENTKDLLGNARVYVFNEGTIDLGVYESSYTAYPYIALTPDANGIVYVKETAMGDKNGSSWNHATDKLKKAIRVAGVQQVWAAKGTYLTSSIKMMNNVAIYGGFDPDNNIDDLTDTRILPDFGGLGGGSGSIINAQNTGAVISNNNNGLDNTAVLDGFTLTNGRNSIGGGIYNNAASPTLRNLWIKANTATSDGGGMYNINSSSPIITNVTIEGNTASYAGGVFNRNSSSPVMTNVAIKNNTASSDGGGMYNDVSASPVLTNVSIVGNSAQNGAGMYNRTNSSPTITNALIANNTATTNGGAIRNEATSSPALTNVTIANNGGSTALYTKNGTIILNNSIAFGAVWGTYTPQYSLIEGNTDFTNGNFNAADIVPADIFTHAIGGDYSLKNTAVVLNAGSNALFAGLDVNTKDLAGNPRIYNNSIIDLGAYEYQGDPAVLPVTLISFTAKADGNYAKLQWRTASESNNKGFIIYRSGDDGIFVKIGNVETDHYPSPYNTDEQLHGDGLLSVSTYIDNHPLNGNNYYRLVQIDNDGKTADLGVRTVTFNFQPSTFNLYPNPTTNQFTVAFEMKKFSQLEVADVTGKILQRIAINAMENNKVVSLGVYPAGVYLVKLNGNGKTESGRIIKR